MLINDDRKLLLKSKMLKTDIARELYKKYFHYLFEFTKDIKKSNVKEISIKNNSVVITTINEGLKLNCPEGEMTAAMGQLILAGTESEEQNMMIRIIKKMIKNISNRDFCFFDIGANIGWYSIYFDKLFEGINICAFEPIIPTYKEFVKNIKLNNCTKNVNSFNIGFSDENKEAVFYVSPSVLAASSLADTYQSNDKIKMNGLLRTLDDFCYNEDKIPDFIKCDVEGAELLVFKGASKVLEEKKPLVMTELLRKWSKCFNYHPNDVLQIFFEKNYSCFVISKGKLSPFKQVDENTKETNYFFLHNQKHNQLIGSLLNEK